MRHFAGRAERAAHVAPPVIATPSLLGAGTVLVTAWGYAPYMVAPVGAQEGDVHEWVRSGLAAGHAPGRDHVKGGRGRTCRAVRLRPGSRQRPGRYLPRVAAV